MGWNFIPSHFFFFILIMILVILALIIVLWVIIKDAQPTLDIVKIDNNGFKVLLWYTRCKDNSEERTYIVLFHKKAK